jgi:hypothetical protein
MQALWNSGASITCQMALRALSQKTLDYFVNMKQDLDELRKNIDYSKTDALPNDDYRRLYILVTHEDERTFEDVFHRNMMSCFLLCCLKAGGFFEGNDDYERQVSMITILLYIFILYIFIVFYSSARCSITICKLCSLMLTKFRSFNFVGRTTTLERPHLSGADFFPMLHFSITLVIPAL